MRQNLKLTIDKAYAGRPFPYIAVEIGNAVRRIVMIPCKRTCSCCYSCRSSIRIEYGRNCLVGAFGNILTKVVIAIRLKSVLQTPQRNYAPFQSRHAVPTSALVGAVFDGLVVGNVNSRILCRKGIASVVLYDIFILGEIQCVYRLPIYDERRENLGGITYAELRPCHLRYLYHDGGHTLVIIYKFVTRAYRLQREVCNIKITAH